MTDGKKNIDRSGIKKRAVKTVVLALICWHLTAPLYAVDTLSAVRLSGDQGYLRLAQDGIQLEAGQVYLSRIRVKGYIRPGAQDYMGELFNEQSVEYSDYWFEYQNGWTWINRLIRPAVSKAYDFRISIWSTRSLTVEQVDLWAINNPEHNLLANGDFQSGLDPWFADGGQLDASQESPEGSRIIAGSSVSYTRFDGIQESLRAFPGKNVMLLIPHNTVYPVNDSIVETVLSRLDSSWELFERFTGFNPVAFQDPISEAPVTMPTLAVVKSTCGAGCGNLGSLGIEVGRGIWEETYEDAVRGSETRGVFEYEMGRNFWGFDAKLQTSEVPAYHMATAFATIMGYLAGVAAGSTSEPGVELVDWVQTYRDGYHAYFENPDFSVLLSGGIDAARIHGGLWLHLMESETGFFFPRYFRTLLSLESTGNLQDAISNHVIASSVGVGRNLTGLFESLDFPLPPDISAVVDTALENQPRLSMANDIDLQVYAGLINELLPTQNDRHPWSDLVPVQLLALDGVDFDTTQIPWASGAILLEEGSIPVTSGPLPYLVADPFGNFDESQISLQWASDGLFDDSFERADLPN